jgi:PST family polysaccharide transporter
MSAPMASVADSQVSDPGLGRIAVRSSFWTISIGLGTRFLGIISTLILTHFIAPYDYGELSAATVIIWTANGLSSPGIGTYVIAHPRADRAVMFHATFLHVALGVVAFAVALAIGGNLGPHFDAPHLGQYLPGMALALFLERVNVMPDRVLVRGMQFGALSGIRAAGEIAYTAASIWTAARGWGAMAVVFGNVVRAVLRFFMLVAWVSWRDWLQPARLRLAVLRDILRFGGGVMVGGFAGFAIRRWDNLVIARLWGPTALGAYNLAYNLADVPAVQIGEPVSDVLQAAFARAEGTNQAQLLLRSTGLLAFVMTPLAVGLGSIAPTLAATFFDHRWAGVGPMLMALAAISLPRPISGTITSYLQVRHRVRVASAIEVATVFLLLGALLTIGRLSPVWACIAVGLVFGVRLIVSGLVITREAGVTLWRFLAPLAPPLAASVPLAAAVAGVHRALARAGVREGWLALALEVAAGAVGYLLGAAIFARPQGRAFVSLFRNGRLRRAA